jgi:hypothetical protein
MFARLTTAGPEILFIMAGSILVSAFLIGCDCQHGILAGHAANKSDYGFRDWLFIPSSNLTAELAEADRAFKATPAASRY